MDIVDNIKGDGELLSDIKTLHRRSTDRSLRYYCRTLGWFSGNQLMLLIDCLDRSVDILRADGNQMHRGPAFCAGHTAGGYIKCGKIPISGDMNWQPR